MDSGTSEVVPKLLIMAGPLLGALVGGLISILSTGYLERQRWRRLSRDKLSGLRREALCTALEWIGPMRVAESLSSSLVIGAMKGDVDDEQFQKEFPQIIGDLATKDLPGSLHAVLPENICQRGYEIISDIKALRISGRKQGQEERFTGKAMLNFQECGVKLEDIRQRITALETDLRQAFNETFQ